MKVIMLAAGVGQRLGSSHNQPKCLLEFNGQSLLSRHISAIEKQPVSELLIVTGYKHELIKNELDNISTSLNIRLIINNEYDKGSVLSFLAACNKIHTESPTLVMDADVLYEPELLDVLITSPHENIFLLDRKFEPGDEPVKLCVINGKIIEFRKQLADKLNFDLIGESVGFFRFSKDMLNKLHKQAEKYFKTSNHDAPYEEVIRDILLAYPELFNYEDITGIPWIEIDFPEDILKAEKILQDIYYSKQ